MSLAVLRVVSISACTRRLLVAAAACLLACGDPAPRPSGGAAGPVNVVLVTLDTLRADALGVYGQERPTSPSLDAVARAGAWFEACLTVAPVTLPSHATLFTGQQPYVHGARWNAGYVLSGAHETLAERFAAAGYRTAAEVAARVLGRETQLDQGFSQYRDPSSSDVRLAKAVTAGAEIAFPYRRADDITRRGIAFLHATAESPFFLWLHYFDPHSPYAAPERFAEGMKASPYHAEVRHVDHYVGRFLAELDDLGLSERTLVVVTSDHGESLGEHGEASHSFYVYDATMRVPLILRGPGVPRDGRAIASLVRSLDVAPTILDLAGLPGLPRAQGVSLRPLLEGTEPDLALSAYGESFGPRAMFGGAVLRFLRQDRWKYIHKLRPELYDVVADPGEQHDLAARHPERVAALRAALVAAVEAAPARPDDSVAPITAETAQQLAELGYVVGDAGPALTSERAALAVGEVDPSDQAADLAAYLHAWDAIHARDHDAAAARFGALLERHPGSEAVVSGLVEALWRGDRAQEALPVLRAAVVAGTRRPELFTRLGTLLVQAGERVEAEAVLRAGLEVAPCALEARVNLSNLLQANGRYAEQHALLEAGVAACPAAVGLANDLAYALATCPDRGLRDGERALSLARRVVAESGQGRAPFLDTLAAALAEAGYHAEAAAESRKALALLEGRGVPEEIVAVFRAHLVAFEAGRALDGP